MSLRDHTVPSREATEGDRVLGASQPRFNSGVSGQQRPRKAHVVVVAEIKDTSRGRLVYGRPICGARLGKTTRIDTLIDHSFDGDCQRCLAWIEKEGS